MANTILLIMAESLLKIGLEQQRNVRRQVLLLDALHQKFHALNKNLIVLGVVTIHPLQLFVKADNLGQESFVKERGKQELL